MNTSQEGETGNIPKQLQTRLPPLLDVNEGIDGICVMGAFGRRGGSSRAMHAVADTSTIERSAGNRWPSRKNNKGIIVTALVPPGAALVVAAAAAAGSEWHGPRHHRAAGDEVAVKERGGEERGRRNARLCKSASPKKR